MRGPYAVVCRGHSGGRVVSEALSRNGVAMGETHPRTWDTVFFAPGRNAVIRDLILSAYDYSSLPDAERQEQQRTMRACVDSFRQTLNAPKEAPFGWKFGETVFVAPVLLDAVPEARVIHIIRDGRDVMLSRLEARFETFLTEPFNKVIVFGDADVDRFLGAPLNAETVAHYRNELEMTHWVTAVRFGLRLRAYGARVLEVRYEDMCTAPLDVFEKIFTFLDMPFQDSVKTWLGQTVRPDRIGKWKSLPPEALARPLEIGKPLLRELGYLEG